MPENPTKREPGMAWVIAQAPARRDQRVIQPVNDQCRDRDAAKVRSAVRPARARRELAARAGRTASAVPAPAVWMPAQACAAPRCRLGATAGGSAGGSIRPHTGCRTGRRNDRTGPGPRTARPARRSSLSPRPMISWAGGAPGSPNVPYASGRLARRRGDSRHDARPGRLGREAGSRAIGRATEDLADLAETAAIEDWSFGEQITQAEDAAEIRALIARCWAGPTRSTPPFTVRLLSDPGHG